MGLYNKTQQCSRIIAPIYNHRGFHSQESKLLETCCVASERRHSQLGHQQLGVLRQCVWLINILNKAEMNPSAIKIHLYFFKIQCWANKMAQLIKVLAAKPDV